MSGKILEDLDLTGPPPWLASTDYVMGLGRMRLRKPGELIQPYEDRLFLHQHGEEIRTKVIHLGLVDGVAGVARPLSAETLTELGLTRVAPITISAVLPDFFDLYKLGFRNMQEFMGLVDQLVVQLRLLPSLPKTPKALRALQRAVLPQWEQRHWKGNGFHLKEPGANLYDEKMEAAGYDLDATPWVLDSFDWELDPAEVELLRQHGLDDTAQYDDDESPS